MKIINLTLLFLLGNLSLFAQDDEEMKRSSEVKITKSEAYPVVDAYSKTYYKVANDEILAIKRVKEGYLFQKFSGDQLNLKSSFTEAFSFKGVSNYGTYELDSRLVMMYSILDKKAGSETLYAQSIDKEKGAFDGDPKVLLTVEKEISSFGFVRTSFNLFSFDISADKKMFAVKYRYKPAVKDDSKNNDVFGMHVFDSDLNQKWNADFTMPYTESLIDNLDFSVDSEGNGFFLIKKYKEEKKMRNRNNPDNESVAILIASADGSLKEVEFNLGESMIDDVIMKENKNGDIICAGYYRKPKSYGVDGTFVSILDSKGNLSTPKFYEFSLDFIKKYKRISERGKKKMAEADENDNLTLANLTMSDVEILDDGGIVLAGEIFYITTYTDSKGNTHTTYHYDDVIVVKINADGELGWMQKFPKRSTVESFRLFTSQKCTYILFTDNPKNADLPDDQSPHASFAKERFVIAYKTDNMTGERKHLALFGFKQIDGTPVYQYAANRVIPLTDNSFAIELYIKQKSDMMFKVEFEE
ncbi:hypothetical protein [Fluviicola taffensis]|uniref:hypothetical protein n=1 Tax=Fluviicola taffensis TaxID=191579 RepID=UPI003137CF90